MPLVAPSQSYRTSYFRRSMLRLKQTTFESRYKSTFLLYYYSISLSYSLGSKTDMKYLFCLLSRVCKMTQMQGSESFYLRCLGLRSRKYCFATRDAAPLNLVQVEYFWSVVMQSSQLSIQSIVYLLTLSRAQFLKASQTVRRSMDVSVVTFYQRVFTQAIRSWSVQLLRLDLRGEERSLKSSLDYFWNYFWLSKQGLIMKQSSEKRILDFFVSACIIPIISALSYSLRIVLLASEVQSRTTNMIRRCCLAMSLSEARTIAFRTWLWLPSQRPISSIHILMMRVSERARQKRAICFQNIFSWSSLYSESKPQVSIMLRLLTLWNHTPLVHRFLTTEVSSTGKVVLKTVLRRVLLPELWVPKIAILELAPGNLSRRELNIFRLT